MDNKIKKDIDNIKKCMVEGILTGQQMMEASDFIGDTMENCDIEKGIYKDNPQNRKLGRVGQKYGNKEMGMPSKVKMAKEIHEAFGFLGIPPENFSPMKEKYGGVEGLYKEMERRLSGKG